MRFRDNVIIHKVVFERTAHSRCIYHKVINSEPIFMLQQVDDFMLACQNE